ncbi:uncharacterized protein N7479_008724 [Penicillium vulpinum]|uniref:Uncharacterized protein n=1 Tax=Penicillium vulpinum TaxID=29845 RepID=A0A1V6S234_9EURO|nr:uncharacterized protein N7479_008724 [Penicillium vulpinum]KAJ5950311.1 hypothetical protein N7479_008724 [Penicillium vulpinum]OQE07804.1 hypothetical protein PENVUL_c012G08956 [Penicillium vulpinum]
MLPSKQSSESTAYKAFRPVTPVEQTATVWELGNVPIAPSFYQAHDEQPNITTLPDLCISNRFNPFLPKLSQWPPPPNFPSPPKPRKLLPAFSLKGKQSQSQRSGSSTLDSKPSGELSSDMWDFPWGMKAVSLKSLHRKLQNAVFCYNLSEKEAIANELARREKNRESD